MDPIKTAATTPAIELEFSISGGRCAFLAGEKIAFRLTASSPSHIAILSHQSDGRRIVVYPNIWDQGSLIPADTPVEIPEPGSGFELESGPPFGTDLVELVAFHSKEDLARLLLDLGDSSPDPSYSPRPDPVAAHAPSGRASLLVGSFPAHGHGFKLPACIDSAPGAGIRIHADSHSLEV